MWWYLYKTPPPARIHKTALTLWAWEWYWKTTREGARERNRLLLASDSVLILSKPPSRYWSVSVRGAYSKSWPFRSWRVWFINSLLKASQKHKPTSLFLTRSREKLLVHGCEKSSCPCSIVLPSLLLKKICILQAFISGPVFCLRCCWRMDMKPLMAQHNRTLLSSKISSLIHDCEWRGLDERQCIHCTSRVPTDGITLFLSEERCL